MEIHLTDKKNKTIFRIEMEGNKLFAWREVRTGDGGGLSEQIDITPIWNFFKEVQEYYGSNKK